MRKPVYLVGILVTSASLLLTTGCTQKISSQQLPETKASAYPALLTQNVQNLIDQVNQAIANADQTLDSEALTERVSGPALSMRQALYQLKESGQDLTISSFPTESEAVTQTASSSWPKAVFNITKADDSNTKYVQVIRQSDAHTPYQLYQWMRILPDLEDRKTVIPNTNVVAQGSSIIANDDSSQLAFTPSQAAAIWAEVALNDQSENAASIVVDQQISQMRTEQSNLAAAIGEAGSLSATVELEDPEQSVLAIEVAGSQGALVTATYRYTTTLSEVSSSKPIVMSGSVATLLGDGGKVTAQASWTSLINILLYVPAKSAQDLTIQAVAAEQIMIEASK